MADQIVIYKNLRATATHKGLEEALQTLKQLDAPRLAHVEGKVTKFLDRMSRKIQAQKPLTAKECRNTADDCTIWLALRILDGTAKDFRKETQ